MDGELNFYGKGPDRPWVNSRLTSAGIVGHTTHNSARLWVRVWRAGVYALALSEKPIPATLPPAKGVRLIDREFKGETDFTQVFELDKLKPGTDYYYAVFPRDPAASNPWELPPEASFRRFRTQRQAAGELKFGLISCHMPYASNGDVVNVQMWEQLYLTLEEVGADFLIAGGDQAYVDGNDAVSIWSWLKGVKDKLLALPPAQRIAVMRSWYRDIYRGYWGFPWLMRTFGRFPTYMIWDDHEIMDGWGSYDKDELARELLRWWEMTDAAKGRELATNMFRAATETYIEYEHGHNPRTADGLFDYPISVQKCAFYVLDMRGHRDFNRKSNDRILGKEQMDRFQAWLKSPEVAAARAVFVVSPVPVVHACNFVVNKFDLAFLGLADDLRDEWEHDSNWVERNRMLDAVFELSHRSGKKVAFLSGDVHIGASFRIRHQKWPGACVYQLTSSSITYPAPAALELVIRDAGELGDKGKDKYLYNKIDSLPLNNFGIVGVSGSGAATVVTWDLYSRTPDGKNLVKHRRIEL